MGSATVEEYVELLNAEQHVDLQKLRDYARHGVQPEVRGEVWLYLLGVLSDDKGQEMTSVRSKYLEYEALDKHNASVEKRIRSDCSKHYQRRLLSRSPPGRNLIKAQPQRTLLARLLRAPRGTSYLGTHSAKLDLGGHRVGSIGIPKDIAELNIDRGPNRVNNGRIHALGGIVGEGGLSAALDTEDPESVVAQELKKFTKSAEHIICAYLNRKVSSDTNAKAEADRRIQGANTTGSPDDHPRKHPYGHDIHRVDTSSTTASSADSVINDDPFRMTSISKSQHLSQQQPLDHQPHHPIHPLQQHQQQLHHPPHHPIHPHHRNHPHHNSQHQHQVVHHHHHQNLSSHRSRSRVPSGGYGIEEAVKMRMPRDYEWLPQIQTVRNDHHYEYESALVYLCAPFVKCVRVEAGMYFAFAKLMTMMAEYNATHPLPQQVATFLTLFRTTLPELYSYFEEEEVDIIAFATNWLQHLLSGELCLDDLMRLWDSYFALPDFLDLHLYVCIAILTNCKDSLEELDRSETKSMLYSLPPLDIDRIINEAINIRLSHQQSQRGQDDCKP